MAMAKAGGTGFTLVLGGARSGKSRYAESLIEALPPPWLYVATAEARDAEMAKRIAAHRARRGVRLADRRGAARSFRRPWAAPTGTPVLVDCLTLWLSNRMLAEADMDREIAKLESVLANHDGVVVLVSNEVGAGIVPDNALARRFQDLQGTLNQRIAARASRVIFMVAGLPLQLKGTP
jgi:adenosylcobinamide kinase/adenosylcobinamide-phosphate guanylyltransferase